MSVQLGDSEQAELEGTDKRYFAEIDMPWLALRQSQWISLLANSVALGSEFISEGGHSVGIRCSHCSQKHIALVLRFPADISLH